MAKIRKRTLRGGNMLNPTPVVMVSCGSTPDEYNIITVAWTGTVSSDPPMCSVSIRPERHSYALIKQSGQFVINLTHSQIEESDLDLIYVGDDKLSFDTPQTQST